MESNENSKKSSEGYRKPPISRTVDSFIDDVDRISETYRQEDQVRHTHIRRDKDDVSGPKVNLYDIDYSILKYIQNTIKPTVEDNGIVSLVPVMYANNERWSSIQKHGYLRDEKNKAIFPLIVIKRTGVTPNPDIQKNRVSGLENNYYISENKHSSLRRYDNFSILTGETHPREFFMTAVPDYVEIEYELKIWAEYTQDINGIMELFLLYSGKAFGDKNYYKFTTKISSFSDGTSVDAGADRMVTSDTNFTVSGYLVPRYIGDKVNILRAVSPKKVSFGADTAIISYPNETEYRDSEKKDIGKNDDWYDGRIDGGDSGGAGVFLGNEE